MFQHSCANDHGKVSNDGVVDLGQSKVNVTQQLESGSVSCCETSPANITAESKSCKANTSASVKDVKSTTTDESCSRDSEVGDDTLFEEGRRRSVSGDERGRFTVLFMALFFVDLNDRCGHGRNPVRRSNSSPEMSSSWKNNFAKDSSRSFNSSPVSSVDQCESTEQCSFFECKKLGKHCYSKELRYLTLGLFRLVLHCVGYCIVVSYR